MITKELADALYNYLNSIPEFKDGDRYTYKIIVQKGLDNSLVISNETLVKGALFCNTDCIAYHK